MNSKVFGIILACGVLIAGYILMSISYKNKEVRLTNKKAAQETANEVLYDKVWKVISQKTQITSEYKDSFQEVYVEIMSPRWEGGGGEFMKWVHEHNPNFDSSLYLDLMNSIEGLRSEFARAQTTLADIKREHDNLIGTFPGSHFLSSVSEMEISIVTSGKTKEVFELGEENEVDLFD